jgi:hypothetical protein
MVVGDSAIAAFNKIRTTPTCLHSKLKNPRRRLSSLPVQRKQKHARCVVHNTSLRAAAGDVAFAEHARVVGAAT